MFLDESHVWPREPSPRRPERSRREKVIARSLLGFAFFLLILPVSLSGTVDLIRWIVTKIG